jgi:hypothetical protein
MIYGTSDEVTATLRSFTAGKLLNNANFLPQSSTPETDCQVRDSPAGSVCYASGMSDFYRWLFIIYYVWQVCLTFIGDFLLFIHFNRRRKWEKGEGGRRKGGKIVWIKSWMRK